MVPSRLQTVRVLLIWPKEWHFFSALGGYFQRKADFQSADAVVSAYLRGETFATALPDGFAVVTVDGCPLGGIKVKGGIAKNYYPKGLRSR